MTSHSRPEYAIWQSMRTRCHNPKHPSFPRYGGRGITVCDRWRNSFDDFITDVGTRPSLAHTLDRKDNNGDYAPENCHWATRITQAQNTRRNRYAEWNGKQMLYIDIAQLTDTNYNCLRNRLHKGIPANIAVAELQKKKLRYIERAKSRPL